MKHHSQKWFNYKCQNARKKFNQAKVRYRNNRSSKNFDEMNRLGKQYKQILKKAKALYNKRLVSKLRSFNAKNPKEFWNLLKDPHTNIKNSVDFDALTQHFIDLNNPKGLDHSGSDNPSTRFDQQFTNQFINMDFTESEVLDGISQLKLNKAAGVDAILNEFIIHAKSRLASVLAKYFNLILYSGCIPEDWTISIICPIKKKKVLPLTPITIGAYRF